MVLSFGEQLRNSFPGTSEIKTGVEGLVLHVVNSSLIPSTTWSHHTVLSREQPLKTEPALNSTP